MTTIDGVLLDMDGVLTVSFRPIDGAVEAVDELRRRMLPLRVVTNWTGLSRRELVERLTSAGFDVGVDEVLTAPTATAAYLQRTRPGARCFLLGERGGVMEDLAGVDWVEDEADAADVVVVGGADEAFGFDALNRALRMIVGGAGLVSMHRNLSWMTAQGLCLDAGAYLMGLEAATGVTAAVTGKPAPEFFRAALESIALTPERTAMVGDDVETDVLAAQALGIAGVLVRTGKVLPDTLARASGEPDHVIESVAGLPALLDILRH
ncbi:MAG TPA: HAD-IIA family hydrolase [Actinomycetota bacterium]